jgi:DNA repair protein RecN (Recombination protein N)
MSNYLQQRQTSPNNVQQYFRSFPNFIAMLKKLIIRNYAIIDNLTIEPDQHLNTVTGETGAGKSIILGALSLILGERADTSVLINKQEKCIVEAHFDVSDNKSFLSALRSNDLDQEELCIIRREIGSNGKSRSFINDTPVNLSILNELTSLLVDLHQQFGHLALQEDDFQMNVIDALADNFPLREKYIQLYREEKQLKGKISELKAQQSQWQKEADYKQFLYDELIQAGFKENDIEEADKQLRQLNSSERIVSTLQSSRIALEEGEQPLVNELRKISQQLQGIFEVMPEVNQLQERINSAYAELKDIAGELETLENKVSLDPVLIRQLEEKIDTGYRLFKKHGVQSTKELLEIKERLEEELNATLNLEEEINRLTKAQQELHERLINVAQDLSVKRNKILGNTIKQINNLLSLVGMPNARFDIRIEALKDASVFGTDEIIFLLDANKSGQFLPVYKAASGGEMSRIMLCIKSLTAKAMQLPTLIFDEVDTGISGEAAKQVGLLLKKLSEFHQVICITHQPQVAAKGSRHFFVYKEAGTDKKIKTRIRILSNDERVHAIAQMIGGEKPTDAALQNARELVMI